MNTPNRTDTDVADIKEAAQLLRDRANAATPGPWLPDVSEIYSQFQGGPWVGETLNIDDQTITDANSAYICTVHPGVGLMLAGWLLAVAVDESWEPETAPRIRERATAGCIARVILGRPA